MIYIYFDVDGRIREMVTSPVRKGSEGVDTLYAYWEGFGDTAISPAQCTIDYGSGSDTAGPLTADSVSNIAIPYDRERDLRFFQYGKTYRMVAFKVPSAVTSVAGYWHATISVHDLVTKNVVQVLGDITFEVEESQVTAGESLNLSQYNYLLEKVNSFGKKLDDEGLNIKSDTTGVYIVGSKDSFNISNGNATLNISSKNAFVFSVEPTSDTFKISFKDGSDGRSKVIEHISVGSSEYTPTSNGDLTTKKYVDSVALGGSSNIKDGTGLNSVVQKTDPKYTSVDVKTKNPNAYVLDKTLDNTTVGASGDYASSFGGNTAALGKRAMAQGTSTVAKGAYSHAEGDNSVAIGVDSHAEGITTTAYGAGSHSEGEKTIAKGNRSHTEGIETIANAACSHAEGAKTEANSLYSHVEGFASKSMSILPAPSSGGSGGSSSQEPIDTWDDDSNLGAMSHAEGAGCLTYGVSSHAEGKNNIAYGHRSHAEGMSNTAGAYANGRVSGENAHVEGKNNVASGINSHAQGMNNIASGFQSFAGGQNSVASGDQSFAFGYGAKATRDNSFAIGSGEASGAQAFASGNNCQAKHENSAAFGSGNVTTANCQFLVGRQANPSANTIFAVGNGTASVAKSNALEVLQDGSVVIFSAIHAGGGMYGIDDIPVLQADSDEIRLFRHILKCMAGTALGTFEFVSRVNVLCNSLVDLRTVLQLGSGTIEFTGHTNEYKSITLAVSRTSCKMYWYDESAGKATSADCTMFVDTVFEG